MSEQDVIIDQGDVGACDDCGDDAEPRRRTLVEETISGALVRIYAYVCPPCGSLRSESDAR